MKNRLIFFLKSYLFWILLFAISKIVFLIYEFDLTSQTPITLLINSIWHGLIMDVAMTAYVMMIFAVLLAISFPISGHKLVKIFSITNTIFLSIFLFGIVVDFEIYRNWGFHLDATPLQYLKTPKEAAASTPFSIYLLLAIIYAALLFISKRIFKKHVLKDLYKAEKYPFYFLPIFAIIGGSMIIPARGGFDVQPMNTSFVYFSKNIYANHIAVNPIWNFLYAITHMDNYDKNYDCMPQAEAQKEFDNMMKDNSTAPKILNNQKPNIVLIILESFTYDLLSLPQIAPNLNKLSKEGLFFENIYSVAGRSDKGLSAILSGYPAHPGDAVIKNSTKIEKIPNIGSALKNTNYHNSFYYGGDINFANMRSYLNISRFDKIITQFDFPKKYYGSKWGVHDEYVLERFYDDIQKQTAPFFNVLFTLSSHEPFDVPEKIITDGNNSKILNACAYTDKHLGIFIDKMKKTEIWDNTIIIMMADHGSGFIKNHPVTNKERYHIPMIWTGGALNQTGLISKYGSQTDIIATLLGQLDIPAKDFIFSKNLLSPDVKGFSYYTYGGGCGYIDDSCYQVYDNDLNTFLINECNDDKKMLGRVYLQQSYNYFLAQ